MKFKASHATLDVGFRDIESAVRGIAIGLNLCTTTNPVSSAPPWWGRLDGDSPENRTELGRRIRAILDSGAGGILEQERMQMVVAYAKEHQL